MMWTPLLLLSIRYIAPTRAWRKGRYDSQNSQNPPYGQDVGSDLCFGVSSRDRIAPDFTIRHPVWPIVALQRRMRFSAPLARFCSIRCHQRRARRAERASFSGFVSNRDFRVPRLRPVGERALTGPCRRRKRGHPRGPESRPGLPWRSRLARSGPGAAQGLDPGLHPGAWHPLAGRCFPCAYGEPESPTSPPTRPRSGARHGSMTIETARRASLEFVCVFGQDVV